MARGRCTNCGGYRGNSYPIEAPPESAAAGSAPLLAVVGLGALILIPVGWIGSIAFGALPPYAGIIGLVAMITIGYITRYHTTGLFLMQRYGHRIVACNYHCRTCGYTWRWV